MRAKRHQFMAALGQVGRQLTKLTWKVLMDQQQLHRRQQPSEAIFSLQRQLDCIA
jgi:hypothetical protein